MNKLFVLSVSVLLVAMVATSCAIAFVVKGIWLLKGQLKRLYWIAENTHSGTVGTVIKMTKSDLNQKLTHLKILAVVMAILVVSLMISIKLKHSARQTHTPLTVLGHYSSVYDKIHRM